MMNGAAIQNMPDLVKLGLTIFSVSALVIVATLWLTGWRWMAALIAGIAAWLVLGLGYADARDLDGRYANSPNKQWFESQRNSAGQWCCNDSDGHLYYGDYKINEDGSVTAEGHTIESYKVLKSANPMGSAVWWYVENEGGRTTYCFAPGSMG